MTLPEHAGTHEALREARDLLLRHREDREAAASSTPPRLRHVNWALDWFDVIAAQPGTASRTALWVVDEDGSHTKVSYEEMSLRSGQVAAWLRAEGVDRGDRLLLMLGNQVELWETLLACMKLGVVVIPATTLLGAADLVDRVERGRVSHVVARSEDTARFADVPGSWTRIAVGDDVEGWLSYDTSREFLETFEPEVATRAD